MSKVQHSPGKWEYYTVVTDHGGRFTETHFEIIAEARDEYERTRPVCTVYGYSEDFCEEALPNALLLTAAPALQAAAVGALEAIQGAMRALATSDWAFDQGELEEAHAELFEAVLKSLPSAEKKTLVEALASTRPTDS